MTIERVNDRDQLIDDLLSLRFIAQQQWADIERNAHMIETDPTQRVEIEQAQRRQRMRKWRVGIGFGRTVADGRRKLEEFDQRCAALERGRRAGGNGRPTRESRDERPCDDG